MQQRGRDNELTSFLEFCNLVSNDQVDLNFPDDVLAVAQGDPLQNVSLERRDHELISFLEFCNLPSNFQVDLDFPDGVLVIAQGNPLQNDTSLENRNLIQNPNYQLNQEKGLFSPFFSMQLNPNCNNLSEAWHQPYYQLNQECISPYHLPSNQNYMVRPPCQPNTNVASISRSSRKRGDALLSIQSQPTGITMNRPTYNGIGNPASEPMQQNLEGFVRNTRMRVDPGQGRTSMVAVSPNTAWYNTGFPRLNPNPGQLMTNPALASNTLSIPLARPNPTPGQSMTNRVLASNNLSISLVRYNPTSGQLMPNHALAFNTLSIPLAGGNSNPRVGTNLSPMQIIPVTATETTLAPVTAGRVTSQSWYTVNESIPAVSLSSPHQRARIEAVLAQPADAAVHRTTMRRQPIWESSSGASQIRSQGAYLHQAEPTIPSVPAWYTVNEAIPAASPPSSHHQHARIEAVLAQPADSAVQRTTSRQQPIRESSSGASLIRSQGVNLYQAEPTIPSVPASSALSVSVPGHTSSTSQTGNSGARVVQERPRFLPSNRARLPRGTSSTVPLQGGAQNLIRHREARDLVRSLYPEADERQLEILLAATREMVDEWRQIDRHLDMRLDIDHMSHEELMALEEGIGSVSTGVSEEIVNEHMRQRPFSASLEYESEPCCICQEEYVEDDQVGTLDCGHNFHTECIKKWLQYKNICPICKKPGIST